MAIRGSLVKEVIVMAFDTVRSNKMRSVLTVLGVVIGITSIVGMTAMIRGFDQSLREMIRAIGPDTIFIQRFGITSFAGGAEFKELIKRPNLSISDARALEEQTNPIQFVDIELGAGGGGRRARHSGPRVPAPGCGPRGPPTQRRVFYGTQKTKGLVVFGTTENFAEGTKIPFLGGRFFNGTEVQYRKNVTVLGNTPYKLLFEPNGVDP